MCKFAQNSFTQQKKNISTSTSDFDNILAQLFDFMTFNEMREIFPLRGGFHKPGMKILSFDEFSSQELMMFRNQFMIIDVDKGGAIDAEELQVIITRKSFELMEHALI